MFRLPAWIHCAISALLAAGCSAPKQAEPVWTPRPRVDWTHISARAHDVRNDFQLIVEAPTQGLFPANIAVTRVSVEESEPDTPARALQLYADPRNEFLQWNSAFDDQMAVSEVFPIAQRDLGGGEAEPDQILAAFRGLHARLGLLYAVNELSESETEMFGALFDTQNSEPLAVIHAQAESLPPPPDEVKKEAPPDLWETDSRALVRAKFARLAHRCVRELIRADQPAAVEAPAGWIPAGPIRPVEWPPRDPRALPGW